MSTCTVLTGIQADRIYVLYCNCRYPGRPVDGDYKDPPTPPLHALPKIPGIRREGVAQSIMGRSDRRGPAGQGTAEGLGEICSHSWEGGAREAREWGGGVSTGPPGSEVGKLKKVVHVWSSVCDCYISCVSKSRHCLEYQSLWCITNKIPTVSFIRVTYYLTFVHFYHLNAEGLDYRFKEAVLG